MSKFVILSHKRTGSTFLQFALNSHPDILCLDEQFMYRSRSKGRNGYKFYKTYQANKKWTIEKYLDWMFNLDKNVGFRLIYNQEQHYKLLPKLMTLNVKIIHLYRKNQFKRVFSQWTAGELNPSPRAIDPQKLMNEIIDSNQKVKDVKNRLKSYKNHITIEMTQLFGKIEGEETKIKKQGTFNIISDQKTYLAEDINAKLCTFLNVENIPLWSSIAKKNRKPITEYISNMDAVERYFKERKRLRLLQF